jgi:hypothetical protein
MFTALALVVSATAAAALIVSMPDAPARVASPSHAQ